MATKALRQQARQWVEELESRFHVGPPPGKTEIESARDFLRRHDFPTASDYYHRLNRLEGSLPGRGTGPPAPKRNYGGRAAGLWLQVQSVYDHVLVSVCHAGEFRLQRGRIKLTHRFNAAGRVDFVELKFLRALDPRLDGAVRKLLLVREFGTRSGAWFEAEAVVLRVLPRELILIEPEVFRCPRAQILAWLVNLGHWTVEQVLEDLSARKGQEHEGRAPEGSPADRQEGSNSGQLDLRRLSGDPVAWPILWQVAGLRVLAESDAPEAALLRYVRENGVGV